MKENDTTDQMQAFLYDVDSKLQEIIKEKIKKRESGETFNVFDVLKIDENGNTRFLAELLSPTGRHGLKDLFLNAFVETIECLPSLRLDSQSAVVQTQYYIDKVNKNSTYGGTIDILIKSGNKAIIIENKIKEQPKMQKNQLLRYKKFGDTNFHDNYRLLYLTPYGDVGQKDREDKDNNLSEGVDYFAISYEDEILSWLAKCFEIADQRPHVQEEISQYENYINRLTRMNMRREILDIMSKTENIDACQAIFLLGDKWCKTIIENYLIKPLKKFFDEKSDEDYFNDMGDIKIKATNYGLCKRVYFNIDFYKDEWTKSSIAFRSEDDHQCAGGFFCGIHNRVKHSDGLSELQCQLNSLRSREEYDPDYWPCYGTTFSDVYEDWEDHAMKYIFTGEAVEFVKKMLKEVVLELNERGIVLP